MSELPYIWRIVALLAVVPLFISLDLRKPAGERHRWREYAFILGCGAATAIFGVLVDCVTSRVSPDYFVVGKGLTAGPGFPWSVAELGAKAGLSAGVIGAGLVLLVNRAPKRALHLICLLWQPLLLSAMCGLIGGALAAFPIFTHPLAAELLPPVPAQQFTVVWVAHIGVYLGGAAGLILVAKQARAHQTAA